MKKKIITMLVLAMSMSSVMGISAMASTTTATENTQATTHNGERPERNGKMAKVTAVDAEKITVTMQAEPEDRDTTDKTDTTERKTPPQKTDTTDTTQRKTPPEKTDTTDTTTTPDCKGGREMTFDGEEVVITITDEVTVKTMEDGEIVELSYSDIEVDDVLMIEYGEDGETITAVSIRSNEMPQGGGNFKGEKPGKSTTSTTN